MADPTLHPLLHTTYTKENLHRKVTLLKEFFSIYFFSGDEHAPLKSELEQFLSKQSIGDALKESILALPETFFGFFSGDNYNDVLDGLMHEVSEGQVLILYVPTLLPPDEVAALGSWVRENIKEGLFIDLQVDPRVVGGCAFVWNGVYHDYSLKYRFENNRNEIKTLVRNFDNGGK